MSTSSFTRSLLRSAASTCSKRSVIPRVSIRSTASTAPASLRSFSSSPFLSAQLADPPSPSSSSGASPSSPNSITFASLVTEGEEALNSGLCEKARDLFGEALKINRDGAVLFNKGLAHFVLKDHQNAISCWLESIAVSPGNADVHVNIANAYILTNPPRGHLAEKHLREAFELSPLDPEIVYNLAAVLEANGQLTEAIVKYEQARTLGVPKAAQNVISVGAKIAAAQEQAKAQAASNKGGISED